MKTHNNKNSHGHNKSGATSAVPVIFAVLFFRGIVVTNTSAIVSIVLLAFLASCASMNTPSTSLVDTKPVIKIGDTGDAPKDHIVFIPANTYFPVEFSVKGSVFNEDASSKVMVSFKQDMYLYKYWASLDGKTWINSHELMNVIPSGGFDKTGGKVEIELDLTR